MRLRSLRILLPCLIAALAAAAPPTIGQARAFLDEVESKLLSLGIETARADWVKSTYITDDSEALSAVANERLINATVDYAKQAAEYQKVPLPEDMTRKLKLLVRSLTIATPANPQESAELTRIVASMEGTYGKGKYCPQPDKCQDLQDLEKILAESRDPNQLKEAWVGWHAISKPIRKPFERYVELANKGAKELGFKDTGAMWREKYDLEPDQFAADLDRVWEQVRPLYLSLHAYVRNRLREKYGEQVVSASGPIPAHLLGNMWAQSWEHIYPLVAPQTRAPRTI